MTDVYDRIRNRPVQWTDVDDMTPAEWHKGYPQCHHRLHEYKFKIRLSNDREFFSYWVNDGWWITQHNAKFLVTHWVKPIYVG